VLSTSLAIIPLENGVNFFGSKVSVCDIPPAIQSRITVSALEFIFLLLQDDKELVRGTPAANAAIVAAELFLKKSRLFQDVYIINILLLNDFI
jgi:hypothetical protein